MAESLQQTRSPGRSPRSRWVVLALVLWLIGLGLSSQHVHTEPVADLHCSLCQLGHSPALPAYPVPAIRIEPVAAALILLPEPAPLHGAGASPSIRAPPAGVPRVPLPDSHAT